MTPALKNLLIVTTGMLAFCLIGSGLAYTPGFNVWGYAGDMLGPFVLVAWSLVMIAVLYQTRRDLFWK